MGWANRGGGPGASQREGITGGGRKWGDRLVRCDDHKGEALGVAGERVGEGL